MTQKHSQAYQNTTGRCFNSTTVIVLAEFLEYHISVSLERTLQRDFLCGTVSYCRNPPGVSVLLTKSITTPSPPPAHSDLTALQIV